MWYNDSRPHTVEICARPAACWDSYLQHSVGWGVRQGPRCVAESAQSGVTMSEKDQLGATGKHHWFDPEDELDWFEQWEKHLAKHGFPPEYDGIVWQRQLTREIAQFEGWDQYGDVIKYEICSELLQAIESVNSFSELRHALVAMLQPWQAESKSRKRIYVPEKPKTRKEWARVYYNVVLPLRDVYQKLWEEGDVDSPKLTDRELREAAVEKLEYDRSEKTIRQIRQAGDAGSLKEYR